MSEPLIRIADQGLRTTHLVRDITPSETGRMTGVCGRVFFPAALAAPLGRTCTLCESVVHSEPCRVSRLRRALIRLLDD
jgi:hypothetical protein